MGTNAPRPTALVQLWTSSTHTLTLTCTVADQGYEVGDVIEIDGGGRHGIEYDATNVYYYTSGIGIWFTWKLWKNKKRPTSRLGYLVSLEGKTVGASETLVVH